MGDFVGPIVNACSVLRLGLVGVVAVVAAIVALRLTRLDLCREAAWVHALGWAGCFVFQLSTVLLRVLRPGVAYAAGLRWIDLGIQLLTMGSLLVVGVGLLLMRPARGGGRG
jgi:hypothetical protein